MPEGEDLAKACASGGTAVIHLAAHQAERVRDELLPIYGGDAPVAVAAYVSRPEEVLLRTTLAELPEQLAGAGITRTAVIMVGKVFDEAARSGKNPLVDADATGSSNRSFLYSDSRPRDAEGRTLCDNGDTVGPTEIDAEPTRLRPVPDAYAEAERAGRDDSGEQRQNAEGGADDAEDDVPAPLTATPLERTRDEVDSSELAVPEPELTPEHKAAVIDAHRHDGPPNKILILGGTAEGRKLADLITEAGLDVVTSLAGRVKRPRLPQGEVRIGGFGGPQRMGRYLMDSSVDLVIDATHPFAEKISASALEAATSTGTPMLRLNRPQWTPGKGDNWLSVSSAEEAARLVQERFKRPLLTIGRQQLSAFAGDARSSYLIRCVEPPEGKLPRRYLLMFDRGPFDFDSEHSLLRRHRIDVVVTKNSGGDATAAKLEAARSLHIPVIMIERPPSPPVPTVHTVAEAAQWIVEVFGSSRV